MPIPNITASHTTYRYNSGALPTFIGSGAAGQIAWTVTRGSIAPTPTNNGVAATYTPANQSEAVTVTARDTSDNATRQVVINIEMTFPYDPDVDGIDTDLDDKTNVSLAEDGGPSFLQKGDPQRVFTLTFSDRQDAEYNNADALWLWHRKVITFWIVDYSTSITGVLRKGRFDSKLSKSGAMNKITYKFIFREAVPY
jgi:hypothetical protein